jgi:4,5-dihydroxyphthalate decarboxylase
MSANLKLRLVMGQFGRFKALLEGRVKVDGLELESSSINFNDLFRIVPEDDDFDVAELSTTGFLWGLHTGRDWIAIPVFSSWAFAPHADTVCHVRSGIASPQDLKGKRVGVPEYPVAAILWIRDALESKYGVRAQDLQWFEERTPQRSHYRGMGYAPPKDVPVHAMPAGKSLAGMLASGELDAVIRYLERPGQPSIETLGAHPEVKWLYADRKAEGMAHCRQQGFIEPIHWVIMKKAIAEAHPWVPMRLVEAFSMALQISGDADWVVPHSYALTKTEQIGVAGAGFSPVGLRPNRKAVDRLLALAHSQGFTPGGAPLPIDKVFHASTLET